MHGPLNVKLKQYTKHSRICQSLIRKVENYLIYSHFCGVQLQIQADFFKILICGLSLRKKKLLALLAGKLICDRF